MSAIAVFIWTAYSVSAVNWEQGVFNWTKGATQVEAHEYPWKVSIQVLQSLFNAFFFLLLITATDEAICLFNRNIVRVYDTEFGERLQFIGLDVDVNPSRQLKSGFLNLANEEPVSN